jgi:hypothetical protein
MGLGNIVFRTKEGLVKSLTTVARSAESILRKLTQSEVARYRSLMKRLRHLNAGGPYTREEMNER